MLTGRLKGESEDRNVGATNILVGGGRSQGGDLLPAKRMETDAAGGKGVFLPGRIKGENAQDPGGNERNVFRKVFA